MFRRGVAAALAAATAAALLVTPTAFASQTINWQRCAEFVQLECGSFKAPMDWNHPHNGKTITIAISRHKPKNARTTILTNPGGPGEEGRSLPEFLLSRPKLAEHAEIIGVDIRGVGTLSCGGFDTRGEHDPRDRTKMNLDRLFAGMKRQAELCQRNSGELGKHVNTEQIAKDYNLLRQLLRKSTVDFLGYSGGTWLGAHYATYFPRTLDKIVLDSNTEFTADWQTVYRNFGPAAELRFRTDYLPWVAQRDDVYHLGRTAEEVRQTYERTRGTLDRPSDLDFLLFTGLSKRAGFARTTEAFARIAGTRSSSDSFYATQLTILCNDIPFRGTREEMEREAETLGAKYPLMGFHQPAGPCAFWDRPKLNLKRPTGEGVGSLLMVQSARDPQMPLAGAQRAHARFKNSRLLTVENEGDHALYNFGNACVDDAVERYLIDREVPAADLTCQPG